MLFVVQHCDWHRMDVKGFSGSPDGKDSACNAEDLGSIPGLGRSPGEGKVSPLQYSGLEHSMDCTVHGIAESDMTERLSLSPHFRRHHDEHNRAATVELFVVPSLIGQQADFAVP